MTTSPLILLGGQRCGTTAFAYAMNLAFHDAGGHFTVNGKLPYLLHRWLTADDLADRHLRTDEILHALARRPPDGAGVEHWRARVEQSLRTAAREVAEGVAGNDPAVLARRVLAESARDLPCWGDKYNEYLLHLPWLDAALPDARYVVLVRHPLEAARSMLRWTGDRPWLPVTESSALAKWTAWYRHWLAFAPSVPEHRRLVIDYRALCRGEATDRLSDFVGLALRPYLAGLTPRSPAASSEDSLPADTAAVWQELQEAARAASSAPESVLTTIPQR
ncbi:sulfotransferase [Streptomyces sp. WMMC940]|uniref:sulfotransferase n=1 Tax=Streptomyces sp. WMMC940 TaxID=3015153 RepID=UPI0022B6C9FB|nr:sulfotransferase [Streptomyces sp. WMMC940]MCZ7456169.1 sulfotransferase [Streptomyces sp. WMMC940]